jgi:hypothetical protein
LPLFFWHATQSKRSQWIQRLLDDSLDKNSANLNDMNLTPHATALLGEAMNSFCAGNWVATIILVQAVLDVELATNEFLDGTYINKLRTGKDFVWLRNRRNRLVHADISTHSITEADIFDDDRNLEIEAQKSLKLIITCLTRLPF